MQASKLQMRTNNIMALAAHAVNNQEKLDEMFAANKKTKRDAAKKYGKWHTAIFSDCFIDYRIGF